MTTSAPASGAVKSMRKISLLAMLLAALPAAAYDVNGVALGARESEVKKKFPSIHCKELEWKSRAAERRCDDSKVAFGGAEVRITLYLRKDAVQAFDVRFDAKDTERVAAFAKARYGAPVSETRDTIEIPGKAARQIYKLLWEGGDERAVLVAQPRRVAAFDPHPVDRVRLRQAGFLRRPGHLRALDRADEQDPAAGLLGRAAREYELQVGARPGERFELVGGAPRAVYEHRGPDFGFCHLDRHGVPPLWNAA